MPERPPIDRKLRRFLDQLAAAAAPLPEDNGERVLLARQRMISALESRGSIAGLPNAVTTTDLEAAPGLAVRLYHPGHGQPPRPVLVFLHGGGWVLGSIATHDPFCRLLAEAGQVIVASVEYRLAPEFRFPAQVEDTLAALAWARARAADWGGDPDRLLLGGDSAGGNLAALAARDWLARGPGHALQGLMLLYPATDLPDGDHLSYRENGIGYGLETPLMEWFWAQYFPEPRPGDVRPAPLRLPPTPGFPPTLVTTAEYDVLRDEGFAYVAQLRQAGVAVTHLHSPDMHHNFPVNPGTVMRFPQCAETLAEIAGWLLRL